MNCGNGGVHPAHSYHDHEGRLQVCLGVPPERWGSDE